jgi:hypothetical protein
MFPTTQSKGSGAHHQTGQELFRATRPVLFESTGSSARLPGNFQVDVAPVDNFGSSSTGVRATPAGVGESMFSGERLPGVCERPAGHDVLSSPNVQLAPHSVLREFPRSTGV